MNRRKRKKSLDKHKGLVDQIVQIMDDIDPVGIISSAGFAGFDVTKEYIPEAKEVVLRLGRWNSLTATENGLRHIFDYYFYYPDVAKEYYQLMSRRIWNAWLVFLGKPSEAFPDDIKLPDHASPVLIEID